MLGGIFCGLVVRHAVPFRVQPRGLASITSTYFVDEVSDLGDALAMRCPNEPGFIDGNVLTFPQAPRPGDRPIWETRFEQAFRDVPGIRRRAFFWDDPEGAEGAAHEFTSSGYALEVSTVRVAEAHQLRAPKQRIEGLEVRAAVSDKDWAMIPRMQGTDSGGSSDAAARMARLIARSRFLRQIAEGARPGLLGAWFIASLAGEPVGTLGLYQRGGLARFAFVHVLAHARRQGVGRTMVHEVARIGFEAWHAQQIVILGDEGSAADRMYGELGFQVVARDVGLIEEKDRVAER